MYLRLFVSFLSAAFSLAAAELPVKKAVLYKNGVAWFERAGTPEPGQSAGFTFDQAFMNDVLKSLVVRAPAGTALNFAGYAIDLSMDDAIERNGIRLKANQPLALLLDDFRGARLSLRFGGESLTGSIVSGRLATLENGRQRQELNLLLPSGEIRLLSLDDAQSLKLEDPLLSTRLRETLVAHNKALVRTSPTLTLNTTGPRGPLSVSYLLPAPVWKSSYRLVLSGSSSARIEGWAIVENVTAEDWRDIDLRLVSGRPVSFISNLFEPHFTARWEVPLPGTGSADAIEHEGAIETSTYTRGAFQKKAPVPPPPAPAAASSRMMMVEAAGAPMLDTAAVANTQTRDLGELFEYSFSKPVTVPAGEAILVPFLQQDVPAKRLLIYSGGASVHPRAAVELSNDTKLTLDGGPLTVFDSASYVGEATMETVRMGDKRLLSFAEDLGVRVAKRITTSQQTVREIRVSRGVLTRRGALESRITYAAANAEAKAKLLLIEHPIQERVSVVSPKPVESTSQHHRFSLPLPASSTSELTVVEELIVESTIAVSSLTPDAIVAILENRSLSAAARKQLEAISTLKSQIASTDSETRQTEKQIEEILSDQRRLRENLAALRPVPGQQEQVQRYAAELTKSDLAVTQLRDRQAELRKRRAALEAELNALIGKLEF